MTLTFLTEKRTDSLAGSSLKPKIRVLGSFRWAATQPMCRGRITAYDCSALYPFPTSKYTLMGVKGCQDAFSGGCSILQSKRRAAVEGDFSEKTHEVSSESPINRAIRMVTEVDRCIELSREVSHGYTWHNSKTRYSLPKTLYPNQRSDCYPMKIFLPKEYA
jgi:hypothetical protein